MHAVLFQAASTAAKISAPIVHMDFIYFNKSTNVFPVLKIV
jgi:hypothetical protein